MIKKLEEFSMNAFPSQEMLLQNGCVVRLSGGRSKRLNSVNMIYRSGLSQDEIIISKEHFDRIGFPHTFKLTPLSHDMDTVLRHLQYKESGRTSIQTCTIDGLSISEEVNFTDNYDEHWIQSYMRIGRKTPGDQKAFRYAWSSPLTKKIFASVKIGDNYVAFGVGIIEEDWIGIYGVLVDPDFRRKGLGRKVTESLLAYSKNMGINHAYLQVEVSNPNAIRLYETIGFKEKYQYYYLQK